MLNQTEYLLCLIEVFFYFYLYNHNLKHLHILLLCIFLQMNGIKYQKDNSIIKIFLQIKLQLHLQQVHHLYHFIEIFCHKYLKYIKVYLHQSILMVIHFLSINLLAAVRLDQNSFFILNIMQDNIFLE